MIRKTTLALGVALLTVGCGSGLMPRSSPEPDELAEIKSRILELQRTAAMTRVEIDRLRQQVVTLEARLAGTAAPAAARPEVAPPRPEPPPARPSEPPPASEVEVSDLDSPVVTPPPRPAPSPPVESEEPGTGPTAPVNQAAQALYDRGYTLYHQGRYVDAEAAFRRFLQGYPDTSLSDNAQYWIGESRFARDDHDGALAAFREVVERYPGGNKVADSLLKAADCLKRLGDAAAARATYDEVIERFPGSAAAAMAEERRSQL